MDLDPCVATRLASRGDDVLVTQRGYAWITPVTEVMLVVT